MKPETKIAPEVADAAEAEHDYTWGEMEQLEKAAGNSTEDFEMYEAAKAKFLRKMGCAENFDFMTDAELLCARQKIMIKARGAFYESTSSELKKLTDSFAALKTSMKAMQANLKKACSNTQTTGKLLCGAILRETRENKRADKVALNTIADFAATLQDIRNCESVVTKPFSWPRYVPAELQASIPKIDRKLTNEGAFVRDISKIAQNDSPRKVIDALTQIAVGLGESIASLKSKLPGIVEKCKRDSGCSKNEVKLAQTFRKKFDANIKAQELKLKLVNRMHTKVCEALIRCARSYHEKFYEVLSGKDCHVEKLEIAKEVL